MHKFSYLLILIIAFLFPLSGCETEKVLVNAPLEPNYVSGDVNLNGLSYEIADEILYSNYFVYGLAVFTVDLDSQILATDINEDGRPLTIADLVYLTRITIGDALPIPKVDSFLVRYVHEANGEIKIIDDDKIGAAFIVVAGNESPHLLADYMEMNYAYDGANTRILVWSRQGECFTRNFLNVPGEFVSIEMATFEGQPVKLEEDPSYWFAIGQIVPNPFDSATTIYLVLGHRAQVSLVITNMAGEAAFKINKTFAAGVTGVDWDGNDYYGNPLPNGIYYCSMITEGNKKVKEIIIQR